MDGRANQYAARKADRHDHPGANYHPGGYHYDFLDPHGEPEYRGVESHHQRADGRAALSKHLFILGHGLGAILGNDAARLFANVCGNEVDRSAARRSVGHRRRGHVADVSPGYFTAYLTRGGSGRSAFNHSDS